MNNYHDDMQTVCDLLKNQSVTVARISDGLKCIIELVDSGALPTDKQDTLQDFAIETCSLLMANTDTYYTLADDMQMKYKPHDSQKKPSQLR